MTLETSLSFSVVLFFHLCVILPLLPALSPGYIFPLKQEHCDLSFFFKKKKFLRSNFILFLKLFGCMAGEILVPQPGNQTCTPCIGSLES